MILFNHTSQSFIFLAILIFIALVQIVVIFLDDKLFCSPSDKHFSSLSELLGPSGGLGWQRGDQTLLGLQVTLQAFFRRWWKSLQKGLKHKSHTITVGFYSHHSVPFTLHSSNRRCTMMVFIFTPASVILFQFPSLLFPCFWRPRFLPPLILCWIQPMEDSRTPQSWRRDQDSSLPGFFPARPWCGNGFISLIKTILLFGVTATGLAQFR